MNAPTIVSADYWKAAREELLRKEKEATRALDALAAERRRLPMVEITRDYRFDTLQGEVSLRGLFEGRSQLIVYHFGFDPDWEEGCPGCSSFADNIGHLAHLHARDSTFTLISRAPLEKLERYRERMGWSVPWVSSYRSDFNYDFGVTSESGESFALTVFLRHQGRVFQTYQTTARGVDRLRIDFNLLDLTPFGRQEEWEDSPEGWPQGPPYTWWRRHDEYEQPPA